MSRVHVVAHYAAAAALVVAALLLSFLADTCLGDVQPALLMLIPAVVAARLFPVGPALSALVMAYGLSNYFFAPPRHSLSLASTALQTEAVIFFASGLLLIGLMSSARRQAAQLARKAADLEAEMSGRKAIEEELRVGRVEFQAIAEHCPVGIFRSTPDGGNIFVNDYWCATTGLDRNAMLGHGWTHAIHPDDYASVTATWRAAAAAGTNYLGECRIVKPDGDVRHALSFAEPVRDEAGTVTHYLGLVLDVTQLRQTQHELRHRESQLTSLADHMPAIVYIKNREGRYLQVNRMWSHLFGSGSTLVGKTDYEYFSPDVARNLVAADAMVWDSGNPLTVEESAPLEDGVHTYLSVKFPVRDGDGEMIALGGVSTDITHLKRTQEALAEKQQLLRSLIEVQEQEKSTLCHEFHDGLIQYAVASQMALEGCLHRRRDTLPREASEAITQAIRCLTAGIDDGRRVIRGIRSAVLDDLGLEAAIEDLVEHTMTPSIAVDQDVDANLDDLPPMLQTTVYRVVQEAFNNIRKHSGSTQASLAVRRHDRSLNLTIRDFGSGFDWHVARQKGLGLVGMQERVAIAGGDWLLETAPGMGTTITVRLPIPGGRRDAAERPSQAGVTQSGSVQLAESPAATI